MLEGVDSRCRGGGLEANCDVFDGNRTRCLGEEQCSLAVQTQIAKLVVLHFAYLQFRMIVSYITCAQTKEWFTINVEHDRSE